MKKPHIITVRNRKGANGISIGANTQVLLDGRPLKYLTRFAYEAKAGEINKVILEMVAEVKVKAKVLGKFAKIARKG